MSQVSAGLLVGKHPVPTWVGGVQKPSAGRAVSSQLGTRERAKECPPSCLAVLERKSKIPSAHKVPQGDEDEVGPTEHPQRGRKMGHRHN